MEHDLDCQTVCALVDVLAYTLLIRGSASAVSACAVGVRGQSIAVVWFTSSPFLCKVRLSVTTTQTVSENCW